MLVFVYGTLKKGYGNHYLLKNFSGQRAMAPGINLYAGTSFPFAKKGAGMAIGELYEIDTDTLKRLDILEGHPNFYHREEVKVRNNKMQEVTAWIYLYDDADKFERIDSGEWM